MITKSLPIVSKVVFSLISLALALSACALISVHLIQVFKAIGTNSLLETALIEAVEHVIIGLAIFDVARFVLEEEVISTNGKFSPASMRHKISRFTVVIVVAVALEALLKVLGATGGDVGAIVPAAFLLLVDGVLLMGLGVFLWLSVRSETAALKGNSTF